MTFGYTAADPVGYPDQGPGRGRHRGSRGTDPPRPDRLDARRGTPPLRPDRTRRPRTGSPACSPPRGSPPHVHQRGPQARRRLPGPPRRRPGRCPGRCPARDTHPWYQRKDAPMSRPMSRPRTPRARPGRPRGRAPRPGPATGSPSPAPGPRRHRAAAPAGHPGPGDELIIGLADAASYLGYDKPESFRRARTRNPDPRRGQDATMGGPAGPPPRCVAGNPNARSPATARRPGNPTRPGISRLTKIRSTPQLPGCQPDDVNESKSSVPRVTLRLPVEFPETLSPVIRVSGMTTPRRAPSQART